MTKLDRTDARLLLAMCDTPRATGVQLAAMLNLARNTVQARLARWDQEKVLAPIDRCVSPRDLGYPLQAFITAVVDQHRLDGGIPIEYRGEMVQEHHPGRPRPVPPRLSSGIAFHR